MSPETVWKVRQVSTGLFSQGGVTATFTNSGKAFSRRVGAKGHMFHWAYGFRTDSDGVRRFHLREGRAHEDIEAVELDAETGRVVRAVKFEDMFTKNQLLNKEDRSLDGLSPDEIAQEKKKKF